MCLGESSAGSSQTDPSLLAVFFDYIKLMPMVAEANQMSQELSKVTHGLRVKNSVFNVFLESKYLWFRVRHQILAMCCIVFAGCGVQAGD